jgi:hypothetical protein
MILSLKCGKCGFPSMASEDTVACEIDFLESRILYVCPKCKHHNVMQVRNDKVDKEAAKRSALPQIGIMRG